MLRLTRLEVKARISELEKGRDRLVGALGKLVVNAPSFSPDRKGKATSTTGARLEEDSVDTSLLGEELLRVVSLLYETDDRSHLVSFATLSTQLNERPASFLGLLKPLSTLR